MTPPVLAMAAPVASLSTAPEGLVTISPARTGSARQNPAEVAMVTPEEST